MGNNDGAGCTFQRGCDSCDDGDGASAVIRSVVGVVICDRLVVVCDWWLSQVAHCDVGRQHPPVAKMSEIGSSLARRTDDKVGVSQRK